MLVLEGHPGPVTAIAFSPNGEILASAGMGGTVRIWRPPADVGALKSEADVVNVLAFSPDGRFLAVGGLDRRVNVWSVEDRLLLVQSPPKKHPISAMTFVGPGTVLYGIGERPNPVAQPATLMLFDLPSGQVRRFPFDVVNGIRAVAGLPDRRVAAWATDNKLLRVQDITRPPGRALVLKNDCRALALSPDGRRLAVTSDWEILLFDVERAWPVPAVTVGRHQGVVNTLAFGPDGRTLYSGGWDNAVRAWDLDRGTERATFNWPIGNRVMSLAVSPDGLRAAAGGDVGAIAVWDLD